MRYLLIAEKPSLMRAIRDCYEKHKREVQEKVGEIEFLTVSGHVCRNAEPNEYPQWSTTPWGKIEYPMVPETWKTMAIKDSGKQKMLKEIREKVKECGALICATDSDAEGYGIHYLISEYYHLQNKPTLRFIEHSLTDKELLHSLLHMTDLHTDPVHIHFTESYLLRSRADWLYGFNLSRMMAVVTGSRKNVGRVKAPTIKMVYDRCNEIDGFVKKIHYEVAADYGEFKGKLVDEKGNAIPFEKKDEIPADIPLTGVVTEAKEKEIISYCQQLYDLSALQTDAGRLFGYSPQQTLDTAQALYETHKLLSYPRTQCRYVSRERAKEFPTLLQAAFVFSEIQTVQQKLDLKYSNNDRVINDEEVEKEAHDALLPTGVKKDPSTLNPMERNIYFLVCKRLAEQCLPPARDKKTMVTIGHPDKTGYLFKAEGNVPVERGWRILSKQKAASELPPLKKGQQVTAKAILPVECATRPPKRFTQASLGDAMKHIAKLIKDDKEAQKSLAESNGIGKASTRAKIITEIIKYGYVEERKDGLYITDEGRSYVQSLQSVHAGIEDPIFAARMDMKIKQVQRGEIPFEEAYRSVIDSLRDMTKKIQLPSDAGPTETNIPCPKCGKKLSAEKWSYICSCGYKTPRVFCGHIITEEELTLLFAGKAIGPFGMRSKAGKTFTAKLVFGEEGKLTFPNDMEATQVKCPKCGKLLEAGTYSYNCECGYKTSRLLCGYTIGADELEKLLDGEVRGPYQFKNKAGKKFDAKIRMKEDYSIEFLFEQSTEGKETNIRCPECQKFLKTGKFSYICSCGFRIPKLLCGVEIKEEEAQKLLRGKKTGPHKFTSKAGKSFQAYLYVEDGGVKFDFVKKK